jgi:hypothetical protein
MKFKVALWLGCGALVTIAIIGSQLAASAQWSKRPWVDLRKVPGNIIELAPRRSRTQNVQRPAKLMLCPSIVDSASR